MSCLDTEPLGSMFKVPPKKLFQVDTPVGDFVVVVHALFVKIYFY